MPPLLQCSPVVVGPHVSLPTALKYSHPAPHTFPFLLPPSLSLSLSLWPDPMSTVQQTGVPLFQIPGSEFSPSEIEELLSCFEPAGTGAGRGVLQTSSNSYLNSNSGSDETTVTTTVAPAEDRKWRRKASNRESARRSRQRKKLHVEKLTGQVNRLRFENRELSNRFGLLAQQIHAIRGENHRLRSECIDLVQRLLDSYQILDAMQLQ